MINILDELDFKWNKERRPHVTNCCKSFIHVETNKGTFCMVCKELTDKHKATVEDFVLNGISMNDEKLNQMYEP